jgi:hypothetical protein
MDNAADSPEYRSPERLGKTTARAVTLRRRRHLTYCASLETVCRIVSGAAGNIRFGSHTTAHALAEELRLAEGDDPRMRRLTALLDCSIGFNLHPSLSRDDICWCLRMVNTETRRTDAVLRLVGAVDYQRH